VTRWTGTWLSGLGAAGVQLHTEGDWRGKRYGLPESGPGSMATFGNRVGAVVVDLVVAGLIGGLGNLLTSNPSPVQRQAFGIAALIVLYVVLLPTSGQTFGMRVARLRVVRLRDGGLLGVPAAFLRVFLVVLTIPALFTDRDGRGLHDRAAGSIIVRT
jgi:uncharacterized RDD family membrane protein YckC